MMSLVLKSPAELEIYTKNENYTIKRFFGISLHFKSISIIIKDSDKKATRPGTLIYNYVFVTGTMVIRN